MKKKLLTVLLSAVYYLLFTLGASAQDATDQQINDLKTRIASKVAELKLVEKRGIIGKVTDVSATQITVLDLNDNTRFIDVDEFTKFSSPAVKGSFGISDISTNQTIGVLGLYNKESRRILARFVNVLSQPQFLHGAVISLDSNNFSFDIATEDKQELTVDVETTTKTFFYAKEGDLVRSGFSKIRENGNVIIAGFLDLKDKTKVTAQRIILFEELPKNPKIVIVKDDFNNSEKVVPSTGSGKKLTPIVK